MNKHLRILGAALCLGLLPACYSASAEQPRTIPSIEFDSKQLLKQFQRAQAAQLKALQSREAAGLKKLKKDQKARQDQFDHKENEERHKYFADLHPGEEKRAYIKGLLARRSDFQKQLADERTQAKTDSDHRIEAMKLEQADHLLKFKAQLAGGVRPDDSLWPQPGSSD